MTKRFILRLSKLGNGMITDTQKKEDLYFDKEFLDATLPKTTDWLNKLYDENEQLKSDLQNIQDSLWTTEKIRELEKENEQLKQQKPFLKIIDDYFIQYEDGELFNLHKPSDIRSLMYILNRGNGYGELECEYNDLGKSDVE